MHGGEVGQRATRHLQLAARQSARRTATATASAVTTALIHIIIVRYSGYFTR